LRARFQQRGVHAGLFRVLPTEILLNSNHIRANRQEQKHREPD
jgi:hypothetical protein